MSSKKPERHPVRDNVIAAAIYTAEVLSAGQEHLPQHFPTPTLPSGRPLLTQEERDLAAVKQKQDEDRLFDFTRPVHAPEQVEQRPREQRSER
ncbi:hypothetical protein FXF50_11720 [Micromonospora sp. AP08]|uniref:hypothetical protein n=1 Tax=Micromonospora sp. AP08 TaxID=2604467 RepID=UPI0011D7DF02|nr:hypothetical protein [Micromonospora sp. AP08]TYB38304.1 hypothetical protein FXF50_11720 [Micromonospora sp. AP08]